MVGTQMTVSDETMFPPRLAKIDHVAQILEGKTTDTLIPQTWLS
jgi:hypothetical protein